MRRGCLLVRASGDWRSEVKEEGWAKPRPGDMSGAGHLMASPAPLGGCKRVLYHPSVEIASTQW